MSLVPMHLRHKSGDRRRSGWESLGSIVVGWGKCFNVTRPLFSTICRSEFNGELEWGWRNLWWLGSPVRIQSSKQVWQKWNCGGYLNVNTGILLNDHDGSDESLPGFWFHFFQRKSVGWDLMAEKDHDNKPEFITCCCGPSHATSLWGHESDVDVNLGSANK